MIRVKKTRSTDTAAEPNVGYRFKDAIPAGGLPQALGLGILSLAVYIKSMFASAPTSSRGHEIGPPRPIADSKSPPVSDHQALVAMKPEPEALPTCTQGTEALTLAGQDFGSSFRYSHGDNVVSLFGSRAGQLSHFAPIHTPTDRIQPHIAYPKPINGAHEVAHGAVAPPRASAPVVGAPVLPHVATTPTPEPSTPLGPVIPPSAVTPPHSNRAPVKRQAVYLTDLYGYEAVLMSVAGFLQHTTDADADVLHIQDLVASSGSFVAGPDGYTYLPDPEYSGVVQVSYHITDGTAQIEQTAHFAVLPASYHTAPEAEPSISAGADHIVLSTSSSVDAGAGADDILGSAGDDLLFGGMGDDVLRGGAGDDRIYGGDGRDQISGGAGDDQLYGGNDADQIWGDEGHDALYGGAGGDYLDGGLGDDLLDGGEGDDILAGGAGDDVLTDGGGRDHLDAGSGDDTVLVTADQESDSFDGGAGTDTLDFSDEVVALTINLSTGVVSKALAEDDHFAGFEVVIGGSGDDLFFVGEGGQTLSGRGGNDTYVFRADDDGTYHFAATISDFTVGDAIETKLFRIFEAEHKNDDSLELEHASAGDQLQAQNFTMRYERGDDGGEVTLFDLHEGENQEVTATLLGHHVLILTTLH